MKPFRFQGFLFVALVLLAVGAFAQSAGQVGNGADKSIPTQRTEVQKQLVVVPFVQSEKTSGAQMYKDYCAVCHGAEGKSDGPAAAFMSTPPPELCKLARGNNGVYPATRIAMRLRSLSDNHGGADMPNWASLFRSAGGYQDLRAYNLAEFIGTLQQ